ncbi:hypothetical protein [Amycolatopsis aidingensis]|uniref:hypothetical protein n=1 Tax=Amycolatopsis aidingensis TaxID=2842453 RepID=UPI001C0CF60F|nr:hypothetical protein [Amycolatopsis aidingensis]
MDGLFQQRRLVDVLVTALPLLVLILGIFTISLVSLALSASRQRTALKILDCLGSLVISLGGRSPTADTGSDTTLPSASRTRIGRPVSEAAATPSGRDETTR